MWTAEDRRPNRLLEVIWFLHTAASMGMSGQAKLV